MSEEDAGNRLQVLVKAVSDDLWIAVATFEVYAPSAFDAALIDKVNEGQIYPAFNVISEALEATTISTLCRIWDKTSDAARIGDGSAASRWSRSPKSFSRSARFGTCASRILTIPTGSTFAC
jgi:hypothetical protein